MAQFLSGDWGSSSFRLRLVDDGGGIRAEVASDRGASAVAAEVAPRGFSTVAIYGRTSRSRRHRSRCYRNRHHLRNSGGC